MKKQWWKEAVGYEIYPRTFCDSNNDGVGDIPGIISKLDYLHDLGINLIWVGPIYQSPMDDNGYDVSDFYKVDPLFGNNEDLNELIKLAHEKGIRIILDLVLNQTSDEHEWFKVAKRDVKSKYHNYYIWKKGKVKNGKRIPPNNWKGFFSTSAWEYVPEIDEYYLHIFSKKMPDLNWENKEVRESMFAIARHYLDLGVDGFRMDAIAHLAKDTSFKDSPLPVNEEGLVLDTSKFSNRPQLFTYLAEFKKEVFDKYNCMTVGEVGGCASKEEALKYCSYSSGALNMVFNFDTAWENGAFGSRDKKDSEIKTNVKNLKAILNDWYIAYGDKAWMPLYWDNHDHPRCLSQYGDVKYRKESGKMLINTLLFMYGTPFIYQGDEIGMSNVDYTAFDDFKDVSAQNEIKEVSSQYPKQQFLSYLRRCSRINARTPIQWDDSVNAGFCTCEPCAKVVGNYKEVNVKNNINDPDSILNFYKKAINLRKNKQISGVLEGKFELVDKDNEDIFSYIHEGKTSNIQVISNYRNHVVKFKKYYKSTNVLLHNYDDVLEDKNSYTLRPFETYLLEVKK